MLERNPALKCDLPPAKRAAERFLLLEECDRLLGVAGPRDRMILLIFLVLGLRPSELFALRVDDVGEGSLRIDETVIDCQVVDHTKTEGSRTSIPLPPGLRDQLLAYIESESIEDFLFPSTVGTAISPDNYLDRVLKPLGEAAGIQDLNHQVLRRTTATHFQRHGEIKDAQALLRHTNASTTLKHYQKTLEDSLVQGVGSWYEELTNGKRGPQLIPRRKRKVS
jgi:integrase